MLDGKQLFESFENSFCDGSQSPRGDLPTACRSGRMNKYLGGFIAASVSAAAGFAIHVVTLEPIHAWVSSQMQGQTVTASWDVRQIALLTSLESGIGLVLLYLLLRRALPAWSTLARGAMLGVLVLMTMGRLFRQPLMNLVIGNPLPVVAVQDGVSWAIWLLMGILVALVMDYLVPPKMA
jgi:hypothetical protein